MTTENLYVGNGSTVLYSFTFPYIESDDIYITLDGTQTTAYTLANATTVEFNTAPASGVDIRIFRDTNTDGVVAEFFPGSAIRAQDLNDNFEQTLYVAQELQNNTIQSDGSVPMVGNFDLNGFDVINGGAQFSKTVDLANNRITNLQAPSAPTDATNREYVDSKLIGGDREIVSAAYAYYTATQGDTVVQSGVNGSDYFSITPGLEQVYVNGALQQKAVDYSAASSQITFTQPLLTDDVVAIHCINNVNVSALVTDAYTYPSGVEQTVQARLEQYVSVKDFGAVGDGVTDDTAALNAAADYAANNNKVLYAPSGTYIVNGPIEFTNNQTSGTAGYGLVGAGPTSTIFAQQDNSANTINSTCSVKTREYHTLARFEDFGVHYSGATHADQGAAIRCVDHNGSTFSHLQFRGAPYGIIGERLSHCYFEHIYDYLTGFATNEFANAFIKLSGNLDPTYASYGGNSFGSYIQSCEMQGPQGSEYGLHIQSSDGLYVSNSHFDGCERTIYLNPIRGVSKTCRQILFSNCYFDNNSYAPTQHLYHVSIAPAGATGDITNIFGIQFTGNIFRGNGGLVQADPSITESQCLRLAGYDFSAQCEYIRNIKFSSNTFLSFAGEVVNASCDPAVVDSVRDITFTDNTVRSEWDVSGPAVRGNVDNVHVGGNLFDFVSSIIVFYADDLASNWLITGNTFADRITAGELITIGGAASDILFQNNNVLSSNEPSSGTDANGGSYIKYDNGVMICTRSYDITTPIDVGYQGGNFATTNLITGTTVRDYPQPFIATPVINATVVSKVGTDVLTVAAGSFTETQWMASLKAIRFNEVTTGVSLTINLTATGRWK